MTHISSSTENSWNYLPAHFRKTLQTRYWTDEAEANGLRWFRQFLVLKIAAPFIFLNGIFWPLSIESVLLIGAVILAGRPRFYLPGLLVILGLSAYEVFHTWPFTINHGGLELVIVTLLCLNTGQDETAKFPSCADIIKILMLSVYFYSGVHKLFDGYYWNGEFFALEALSNETSLGVNLHQILERFAPWEGTGSSLFACCTNTDLLMAGRHISLLVLLAWATIFVELFLPWTVLFAKIRPLAVLALFGFQASVGYFSGETDFAFTAFAILCLFIPNSARWTYPLLACLFILVHPWA